MSVHSWPVQGAGNMDDSELNRGGSRPMQPMRMHRSEFRVNLIPPAPSQVSIKIRKNNNIHILISKRVRVGPIVVLSINNFIDKNNDFK